MVKFQTETGKVENILVRWTKWGWTQKIHQTNHQTGFDPPGYGGHAEGTVGWALSGYGRGGGIIRMESALISDAPSRAKM